MEETTCKKCGDPFVSETRSGLCDACRADRRERLKKLAAQLGVAAGLASLSVLVAVARRGGGWPYIKAYDPDTILEPGTKIRVDFSEVPDIVHHAQSWRTLTVERVISGDWGHRYLCRTGDGIMVYADPENILTVG